MLEKFVLASLAAILLTFSPAIAYALPGDESVTGVVDPESAPGPWLERSNEYFRFVYKRSEAATVDRLMAASRGAYETVTGFVGMLPPEPAVVIVHGSMDSPSFSGMASSFPDRIELQAGQVTWATAEGLLAHEFTHHMQKKLGSSGWIGRVAGIFGPEYRRSLSISFADLSIEGGTSFLDRYRGSERGSLQIRAAVIEGRMWDWDKASSAGLRQPGSLRVYLSGLLFQDWLFDRFGPDAYARVMAARDGLLVPLESEALKAVTGLDPEVAWGEIRVRLEARYAPARSYPLGAPCTPRDAVDETQWSGLLPTSRGLLQTRESLRRLPSLGFWRPDPADPSAPGSFAPLGGLLPSGVTVSSDASVFAAIVNQPEKSGLTSDSNHNRLVVGRIEWSADSQRAKAAGMRTLPGSGYFAPCFSPDGKRLFAAKRASDVYRLVEVDPASGSAREIPLPLSGSVLEIAASPEGTRLALGIVEDGAYDVGIYDLAAENFQAITNDEAMDFAPRFLADGTFVFSSDREDVIAVYRWEDGAFSREILDAIAAFQPVEDGTGGYYYSSYSASGRVIRRLADSELRKESLPAFASLSPSWIARHDGIKRVFRERGAALAGRADAPKAAPPSEPRRFVDVPRILAWSPEAALDPLAWGIGARIDGYSYLGGSSLSASLRYHPDSIQASGRLALLLSWPLLTLELSGGQDYSGWLSSEAEPVYALTRYAKASLAMPLVRWRSPAFAEARLSATAGAVYRNSISSPSPIELVDSLGQRGEDSFSAYPGLSGGVYWPAPRAAFWGGSYASAGARAVIDMAEAPDPLRFGAVADISGGLRIGTDLIRVSSGFAWREDGGAIAYLPRLVSRWNDDGTAPLRGELSLSWAASFLGNEWTDHMVLLEHYGSSLGAKAFWEADPAAGARLLPEMEFSLDLGARVMTYYFSVPARIGVAYRYRFGAADVEPEDFCLRISFGGYEGRF